MAINGGNNILYYGSFYGGYNVNKVGRPIGMIYGYDKLGIFNTQEEIDRSPKQDGVIPGGMKFRDADGNGKLHMIPKTWWKLAILIQSSHGALI